jgi:hypothetical protein
MLAIGIEISVAKKPPVDELGMSIDIHIPPESVEGYIPKNIRMAYILAELAEPYIRINDKSVLPKKAGTGEQITVKWNVGGTINVDQTNILMGNSSTPRKNYFYSTGNTSGSGGFSNQAFTQNLTLPEREGKYYFTVRARVDSDLQKQLQPEPAVVPQSIYVNQRTNESWQFTNGGKTVEGKIDFYSDVIEIEVVNETRGRIEIYDHPKRSSAGLEVHLIYGLLNTTIENEYWEIIYMADSPNNIFSSGQKIYEKIDSFQLNDEPRYFNPAIRMPYSWGTYYFAIEAIIDKNQSIGSEIFTILVEPLIEIHNITNNILINEQIEIEWHLVGISDPVNMSVEPYPNWFTQENDAASNLKTIWGSEGDYNLTIQGPKTGGFYYIRI